MRRGFLRCRKSDSDLPFWNRKILLSPRTYSLPCDGEHRQNFSFFQLDNVSLGLRRNSHPGPRLASSKFGSNRVALDSGWEISPSVAFAGMGNPYLARVNPVTGESIVVRSHCGGWLSKLSMSGLLPLGSKLEADFGQILVQVVRVGLPCDRLRRGPHRPALL